MRLLSKIRIGEITIVLPNGHASTYGNAVKRSHATAFLNGSMSIESLDQLILNEKADPNETQDPILRATIHVENRGFWLRLAIFSALVKLVTGRFGKVPSMMSSCIVGAG